MSAFIRTNSINYVSTETRAEHQAAANTDFRQAVVNFAGRVNGYDVDLQRLFASSWTSASALRQAPNGTEVISAYVRDAKLRLEDAVAGRPLAIAQFIRETAAERIVAQLDQQRPTSFTDAKAKEIWAAASEGLRVQRQAVQSRPVKIGPVQSAPKQTARGRVAAWVRSFGRSSAANAL